MTSPPSQRHALVTGVTGYVGGQLVEPLLDAGWTVTVFTRDRGRIAGHPWAGRVKVAEGDASRAGDLDQALAGVQVAYYLLHSMDGRGDFQGRDLAMAQAFVAACERAGVGRVIYLSGLHPDGELSEHLASRVEVGKVFLDSAIPATVLQAAVVLGDGSASFDMLRFITERLPAMVAPRWLNNRIQPIAVDDVLHYLVAVAQSPPEVNRTFDIGGPDVLTYTEMIQRFARVTGRRRRVVVTLPVLTPRLAGYWIGLVTPVSSTVARPLVDSLVHEVVCREEDIRSHVPDPAGGLVGFDEAVRRAMRTARRSSGPRNLLFAAAAVATSAAAGSLATQPRSVWYRSLDLPPWQPPPVAFPVVWTALYASIAGTAGSAVTALEDRDDRSGARRLWAALAANLALNAGWSWVFWRFRRLPAAAVAAGALAGSSADLARRVRQAGPGHRTALLPYASWCVFATALSAEVARRNPHEDRPLTRRRGQRAAWPA